MDPMPGIYIHVPFCARKCAYCDFYSAAGATAGDMDAFCRLVAREMDLLLERFPGEAAQGADTVYFGGGTPTLLGPDRLVGLLRAVAARFRLSPDAEVTTEANPGTVAADDLRALRGGGFTRISIGVQSFDPATLATLGRIHGVEEVRRAFRDARSAGFESVGLDLIFAVPGQRPADWEADLERTVTFLPEHVSAYALAPEPGTPLHAAVARGELALPGDDDSARMYESARRILGQAGYRQYEISNFCRPGHACRHNVKYWKRLGYVGLGPSAHGLLFPPGAPAGIRTANPASMGRYAERIGSASLPWEEAKDCTAEDAWKESLVAGLRMAEGVCVHEIQKRYGPAPETLREAVLHAVRTGRLAREGSRLRLPAELFFVSNEVLAAFA